MEMALRLIGVGPEDEVIVPAYTYTATASVTQHVGCRLVMVDSQPDCVEMDYDRLADAITERTKVIMPVDLGGIICDYDKVFAVVEAKRGLFRPSNEIQKRIGRIVVAADCAHAFGASRHGVRTGAIADFSSFSFHAVKNLTTADGGAVTWISHDEINNTALYRDFKLISLHGQNRDTVFRSMTDLWEYDVTLTGFKCNMTDIAAAIGLAQMERYDGMLTWRKEIVRQYDRAFLPLGIRRLEHFGEDHEGNAHLYMARIPWIGEEERNRIIREMSERGIRCNVHFKPLPMLTAYRRMGFRTEDYPNAFRQYRNEISLPLYSQLRQEQADYVTGQFTEILAKVRPNEREEIFGTGSSKVG
jgi:dTDP-4-amino-4,6-dideoxygalactose transaminase